MKKLKITSVPLHRSTHPLETEKHSLCVGDHYIDTLPYQSTGKRRRKRVRKVDVEFRYRESVSERKRERKGERE